jgi:hypothetical protein
MKKGGIILPGKIGDIIICLPIAKHYFDMGYEIYWPIYDFYIKNFTNYVNYVNFIPISINNCIQNSIHILNNLNCEIIDLSFTSPNSWHNENTRRFLNQNNPFDEFRYELANVPFSKKWTLEIQRNYINEDILYQQLVKKDYVAMHLEGSDGRKEITIENPFDYQIIDITQKTDSIFDWIKILQNAKKLVMFDSCFANLVEQLNLHNKKIFLLRSDKLRTPVLKNNWTIQ